MPLSKSMQFFSRCPHIARLTAPASRVQFVILRSEALRVNHFCPGLDIR